MILDEYIEIEVKSSRTIGCLSKVGVKSSIGDIVKLPIEKLWIGCNYNINVKCDVCNKEKKLGFNLYNKNIKNMVFILVLINALLLKIN